MHKAQQGSARLPASLHHNRWGWGGFVSPRIQRNISRSVLRGPAYSKLWVSHRKSGGHSGQTGTRTAHMHRGTQTRTKADTQTAVTQHEHTCTHSRHTQVYIKQHTCMCAHGRHIHVQTQLRWFTKAPAVSPQHREQFHSGILSSNRCQIEPQGPAFRGGSHPATAQSRQCPVTRGQQGQETGTVPSPLASPGFWQEPEDTVPTSDSKFTTGNRLWMPGSHLLNQCCRQTWGCSECQAGIVVGPAGWSCQ